MGLFGSFSSGSVLYIRVQCICLCIYCSLFIKYSHCTLGSDSYRRSMILSVSRQGTHETSLAHPWRLAHPYSCSAHPAIRQAPTAVAASAHSGGGR